MGQTTGNYEKMSRAASERFLSFDQEELLMKWPLRHDEAYIYILFLSEEYRIDRRTGRIYTGQRQADFAETMTILDMLCRAPHAPAPTGTWATLTQLASASGAGPVSMDMYQRKIDGFGNRSGEMRQILQALHGTEEGIADVSYVIPVFDDFSLWFQYNESDEDFRASVNFLWDSTAITYLHYETLWYVMGIILDWITEGLNQRR